MNAICQPAGPGAASDRKPHRLVARGGRWLLPIAVVALAACARSATPDAVADKAAIRAVSLTWKAAFNAGDAAAVTALYADDAVLSAPGTPLVRGKAAIGEYFLQKAAQFSHAGVTVTDAPLGDTGASGDLGYQWESYQVVDKSGAQVDAGRLLTLFQRRHGHWLIIGDTWNSDRTAAAADAAAGATPGNPSE